MVLLTLLAFLAGTPAPATLEANWITHPEVSAADFAVVHFRNTFTLAAVPDSFRISITADNHYRLYVNGEWIAWGPQLGEMAHWKYETLDLAPYLRAGENVLAVQVTNWGHYRGFGIQSVHTALLIQGYGAAEVLTTRGYADERYVCYRNPALTPHPVRWRVADPDIIGGLYANNPTDRLVAADYPWGWEQPDFDAAAWQRATFLEAGFEARDGSGFLWMLEPRSTPPQRWRSQQFRRLRINRGPPGPKGWFLGRQSVTLPPGKRYSFLLDMNEVTLGFPELRWSGGRGAKMTYTWAENLFNADRSKAHRDSVAGKLVRGYFDVVVADGGPDRRYVPTWYRAFRYLRIEVETADEPLRLLAPTLRRVTSTVPIVAEWSSDDPQFDAVVEAGRRTVEICTQDYFLSDAYYETMQYIGDTKVHALVWQTLTGDLRHTRNALLDFHRGRNAEGVLKSCYPLRYHFYHATYSLIFVDMVRDYLATSGDTAFVRRFLPGIRQTLDFFGGHYNPRSGFLEGVIYKPFIDWYAGGRNGIAPGGDVDASAPVTLHYAMALRSAAAVARAAGESATATDYRQRAERVVAGIRRSCYVPERQLVAERPSRDFFDQHSSILGVLLDVIPPDDQDAALENLLRDPSLAQATYYYRYYLLAALRKRGRADLVRTALAPWYAMVAEGATAQVERFESPDKPTRSEAHPWGTAPVHFAYTLLAGVDLADRDGPVIVAPAFGHLRRMAGYLPEPGGGTGPRFQLERRGDTGLTGSVTAGDRSVLLRWRARTATVAAGERLEVDW